MSVQKRPFWFCQLLHTAIPSYNDFQIICIFLQDLLICVDSVQIHGFAAWDIWSFHRFTL